MPAAKKSLEKLVSVGPAIVRDLQLVGVRSVSSLARSNPTKLYEKLCRVTMRHHNVCVLDVFCAAVAQARNPRLAPEKCQWWYWSRRRKAKDVQG